MGEDASKQTPRLLSSWKEIASHLGVTVRTAQKWETERGLPVRRVPGGRGRVIAKVDELSAWLHSRPTEGAEQAIAGAKRGWFGIAAVSAVAAVVILAGAWWWYAARMLPSSWRVAGDALVVVDDRGRECWRKVFGFSLTDYQFFVERNQAMGWVGDLDGDGEPEVLFAAVPRGIGVPMVYCFSRTGRERWRFEPGKTASGFPEDLRPPYIPMSLLVLRTSGVPRIVVSSVHNTLFSTQVALLSRDGRLLREYWHSGHLIALCTGDSSRTGKPLVYAGGIANAYRRAVLVALDPDSEWGVSREENPAFQLPGKFRPEVGRVLFGRSCISLAREPYNGVFTIQASSSGLLVGVAEEMTRPSVVHHRFSPELAYRGASFASQFVARHTELEHTKFLDHHLDEAQEGKVVEEGLRWLTPPANRTKALSLQRRDQ